MPTILVIDDDAPLRSAVRAALEAAGYDVIEAADGEEGLRLHQEHGPDLVIVDIFMPERDGLDFIRDVRDRAPQAKILAISGGGRTGMIDVLSAAAALGASRTLSKPFLPGALLAAVRDLLGKRPP
jgi:DNA-binding response OmpR family regulator